MSYEVMPIDGEEYNGRQCGYRIFKDGIPYLDCSTGGTGACWNIGDAPQYEGDRSVSHEPIHICDLDEAIGALEALRDSEANRLHVERWS